MGPRIPIDLHRQASTTNEMFDDLSPRSRRYLNLIALRRDAATRRYILLPLAQHQQMRKRRLRNMKYPRVFRRTVLRPNRNNAEYCRDGRAKR